MVLGLLMDRTNGRVRIQVRGEQRSLLAKRNEEDQ